MGGRKRLGINPRHIPASRWLPGDHPNWRQYGAEMNGGIEIRYRKHKISVHPAEQHVGWLGVIDGVVVGRTSGEGAPMTERAVMAYELQTRVDMMEDQPELIKHAA